MEFDCRVRPQTINIYNDYIGSLPLHAMTGGGRAVGLTHPMTREMCLHLSGVARCWLLGPKHLDPLVQEMHAVEAMHLDLASL